MRLRIVFLLLVPLSVQAQDGRVSLIDLLAQGGWAMWPLGLCSLALFFLLFLAWEQTRGRHFVADNTDGVLARATRASEAKASEQPQAEKADLEAAFAEVLELEESRLAQRVSYLNVIATIAPMVGLLGTVSGMIGAFQVMAQGGMGRPELLAGDIGEALITTGAGLAIGIPAMLAYFVMRHRLERRMLEVTQAGNREIERLCA